MSRDPQGPVDFTGPTRQKMPLVLFLIAVSAPLGITANEFTSSDYDEFGSDVRNQQFVVSISFLLVQIAFLIVFFHYVGKYLQQHPTTPEFERTYRRLEIISVGSWIPFIVHYSLSFLFPLSGFTFKKS